MHVCSQVENEVCDFPRRDFEDSVVFTNMFGMPQGENTVDEGSSPEYPLRLEGVKFDALMGFARAMESRYVVVALGDEMILTQDIKDQRARTSNTHRFAMG
jgi:hypothetical protein